MMIDVDHNHTIGLMQSQEQKPMTCSSVHQLPIKDSNSYNSHQKKFLPSSQVRIKTSNNLSMQFNFLSNVFS